MKQNKLTDGNGAYLPTPEQIATACAEIRSGWKDGLDHCPARPKRIGRIDEHVYSASVEIEDEEPWP